MLRRKRLRVPSCPRCGNEEDLREWFNGIRYCESCIICPHGRECIREGICLTCLKLLYSITTFDGPRIIDMDYYIAEAWNDYGIEAVDLHVWSYFEESRINDCIVNKPRLPYGHEMRVPKAAPPHHRFTSSHGSQ